MLQPLPAQGLTSLVKRGLAHQALGLPTLPGPLVRRGLSPACDGSNVGDQRTARNSPVALPLSVEGRFVTWLKPRNRSRSITALIVGSN